MLEKPNRKKIDKQDGNRPTNIEQLIEKYDLEKVWPYIEDIIENLNGVNIKDLAEFIDIYKDVFDINNNNVAIGQRYDTDKGGKLQVNGDILGNLKGNADTATKAIQDGNGYNISTYYLKNYSRLMAASAINLDNPKINGLFEKRNTELTYTGAVPTSGYYPFLNLKTPDSIAMMQMAGNSGYFYYRTNQAANVNMSNKTWTKFLDSKNWGVVLYNNSSGTTGTVTLNETAANFNYLEIFYIAHEKHKSARIANPNGKTATLTNIWRIDDNGEQLQTRDITISGTTITQKQESYMNIRHAIANAGGDCNSYTFITKVVGYK